MNRTASLLLWLLPCLVALASSSDSDTLSRERRDIRMLRMGKRAFNLLRMGRSVPLEPRMAHSYNERQLDQIPRMGKDIDFYPFRESRSPPLPRLGDDDDERLDKLIEKIRREADVSGSVYGGERSARSVESVLGDGENEQEVRAVPLPRLGLRELLDKYGDEVDPLQHLGYRDADGDKQIDYEELLNENAVDDEERAVPLPRLGMRDEEERAVPLPRLGVRDIDEKKAMGMLRMGKRELDEGPQEKRAMGMLRMGKRAMGMLRMGKRAMGMLRMGKRELDENEMPAEDKRSMSMLRMGKRAMGMLRMGRSDGSSNAEEAEKRGMSMLRMGKKAMGMLRMGKRSMEEGQEMQDKRAMGMLRMGRSMGMLRMGRAMNDAEEEKRAMGMLRMGKRAMGMLRMGKRPVSMLRMGKRAMGKRDLEDEDVQLPAQDKQALVEDSEKTVQE